MTDKFEAFIQQTLNGNSCLNEELFLQQGFDFIKQQLKAYLQLEGLTAVTFTDAIKQARKSQNSETNPRFWAALEAFYLAVEDSIDGQGRHQRWLRFVNIIENLQGYKGSQLINDQQIYSKRIKRLYLAYALTWEHLRYIADNEEDYNPSELILASFSDVFDHHHE